MSKIPMFPNKFAILASILGGQLWHTTCNLSKGETETISTNDLSIIVIKKTSGDNSCIVLKSWGTCYILGDTNMFVNSDSDEKVYIEAESTSLKIKSNITGINNYIYSIVKNVF